MSHAVAVNMLKRIENTAAVIRRKLEEGNDGMDFSLSVGREKGGGRLQREERAINSGVRHQAVSELNQTIVGFR